MAYVYWIRKPSHTDIFTEGYIGVTNKTVEKRFDEHRKLANSNSDRKSIVHKAIASIGVDSIIVETILLAEESYCYEIESKLRPFAKIGWNIKPGGHFVEQTLEKSLNLSLALKGRKMSEEFKEKQRIGSTGRKHTEEAKKKISEANTGKPKREGLIEALAEAKRGVPLSEEHRNKIGAANKNRKLSEETKQKMRLARVGLPIPPPKTKEQKQKESDFWASQDPWLHVNITTDVWTKADLFYEYYKSGKSAYIAGNRLGYSKGSLVTMYKRFSLGWIPLEDIKWLEWLSTQIQGGVNAA